MTSFYLLLSIAVLGFTHGYPAEDEITSLPGLTYTINFRHFSGYLNGTQGKHLHYWFTESQNDPTTDPLILWLNGGPGCSSVSGLLTENGPYFVTQDGLGLYENIYSWNTLGSVLYLESPACVGFSYDENGTCGTNDNEVADMNYFALQHFFEKFPEYRSRDFFITGESYAGIYIPTLTVKIVENNATYPVNLQGFAIGNGLTSYVANENSLMFYGHYHAILGDDIWEELVDRCCDGIESKETCNFYPNITALCEASVLKATDILYYQGINVYNIYSDCEQPTTPQKNRYYYDKLNMMYRTKQDPEPYLEVTCIDSSKETTYLNNPDVRTALHIPSLVQPWEICSGEVNRHYVRRVYNTASQLTYLHDNNVRGLLYNGDVDMAVNFLGNEWDIEELAFVVTEGRTQWNIGDQIAGYVKRFEFLDFLTVKGSGHMVPTDKPAEALQMISAFIRNVPY